MTSKYEKVATPVATEAVAVPIVTITSPANLDEGFVFEAEYDGKPFPVVVVSVAQMDVTDEMPSNLLIKSNLRSLFNLSLKEA